MSHPSCSKPTVIFHRVAGLILCAWIICAGALILSAQEQKISIKGEVPAAAEFSLADLARLPRSEVRTKDRDGKESVYAGTPLAEVLRVAGIKFDPGAMSSHAAVASYVLIEAADGYKAVFALSEIDPTQSNRTVLLADQKDGQPLPAKEAPCRIISPDDKRPTRSVRQVVAISVHQG